jgi:hypothetical protein
MRWDGVRHSSEGDRGCHPPHPPLVSIIAVAALLLALVGIWTWMKPESGEEHEKEVALWVEGIIVDEVTGKPVEADVYLDGRLLYSGVRSFSVEVPSGSKLRVEAPGYHPWALRFRYELKRSQVFQGPIRLKPKEGR